MERSSKELFRRYVGFVVVLFIIAFGTSLSIRANLGSSPISCPPYVLSILPGAWSMGAYVIIMHCCFIVAQIVLLRKDYQKIQLLQLIVSFLFGFYTDVTMWMTAFLQVPATLPPALCYTLRFVELLIGGGILALGIAMEVKCDVLMLAGEGFPLALAKVTKREFGKVKIFTDTGLVCIGTTFMLLFFRSWHWDMVGVGTLVSMFYVGFMVRQFGGKLQWMDRLLTGQQPAATPAVATDQLPLVITISREYGSGGHDVGSLLAKQLGLAFYDRTLINKTAERLGYTADYVAGKEQQLSTAQLWERAFTDRSIPASMNPSHDDAIFLQQCRTIEELATTEPCVIVGRMANWVLRHRKNCLKVFVTSQKATAVANVMAKDNLSTEEATKRIERINKGRANHYLQYSGHQWSDARGYDLTVNTTLTGVEGATNIVAAVVKNQLLNKEQG